MWAGGRVMGAREGDGKLVQIGIFASAPNEWAYFEGTSFTQGSGILKTDMFPCAFAQVRGPVLGDNFHIASGLKGRTFYLDADNDTYGNAAVTSYACTGTPTGYVTDNTDCNDSNAAINPVGDDANCNGIDENCDGVTDGDYASHVTNCGIGACAATGDSTCAGGVEHDNCTAGTPAGSDTTCDGIDDDCNGLTDDGYTGHGTTCGVGACAATGGTSCVGGSEHDNCTAGTPAGSDTTCNGIDDNCNGATDEAYTGVPSSCGVGACASTGVTSCVAGAVQQNCTPGSPTAEVCNGIDDDCDGVVDNGLVVHIYYRDADNDTYGNPDITTVACAEPEGYVDNSTAFDCNDNNSAVHPGATEVCGDGIDNNCDNQTDDNCTELCTVTVVPKKIYKLIATFNPIHPYVISAAKGSGVDFVQPIDIDWGTDAIKDIIRLKIGNRIIVGFLLVHPSQLVAGDKLDVTVTFGSDSVCAGTIEVK